MPPQRDDSDLARAARLYFIDGLSQKEVAQEMQTTRSNVSRMLTAARARGVVEIRIHDPSGRDDALEHQLVEQFGLSEALVARFEPGNPSDRRAGELGAQWLVDRIHDGQRVSLSWGTSLQKLVWAVTADRSVDVEILQLVGGLSPMSTAITGQEMLRELAVRLGARYRYLHSPAVLDRAEAVELLGAEASIAEALAAARRSDIALVGIGSFGHGSSEIVVEQMRLSPEERAELLAAAPVGDICARFYDADGRSFLGAANDRVLGITLDELREIPTVVGVATGREKAPGLLGALRGGLLDVICCDVPAARGVLEMARRYS
ncbi:sugar-binding transcriptional regulator [Nakamurella flava]|uniref:Sugar-binding transcriptional regulator n=1 Tax=Nakamurella flava TaxID=2576308 RepID=A0A4U6QIG0_9ACTN|nr:sugar-binding domain-containing protein [Nakamurella flava]TKV60163.1 sugar-binding transcriptional regulator [Nakamurella flava]